MPPAVEAQSLNHWTTREFPGLIFFLIFILIYLFGSSREKEMATHPSILAWRILWTEEPGGLLSIGSHRVRHD